MNSDFKLATSFAVGRASARQVGSKAKLNEAGIPTAVHYPIPLNKQPAVADKNVELPIGDAIAEKVMSLPMHPYMTEEDVQEAILL
ncbi:MAG: DegT/DnrJ/EryC1/StrS family aminotransferase [Trichlorobacter sp.]|nr:DegT/DnrJ/EryC1/StrS family aminotransferase [Trichlorobacter sp.]